MEEHKCHAISCPVPIPPRLLFCKAHWRLVPDGVKAQVYAAYQHGQEQTKVTTAAYRQAMALAVIMVAKQTGDPIPPIWERLATGTEGSGSDVRL